MKNSSELALGIYKYDNNTIRAWDGPGDKD